MEQALRSQRGTEHRERSTRKSWTKPRKEEEEKGDSDEQGRGGGRVEKG